MDRRGTDLDPEAGRAPGPPHVPAPAAVPAHDHRLTTLLTLLLLTVVAAGAYVARQGPDDDPAAAALIRERARDDTLRAAQQRLYLERIRDLQAELTTLRQRMADRAEIDEQMGKVQRAMAEVETSLHRKLNSEIERTLGTRPELAAARDVVRRFELADGAAEQLIARYAGSVCLIQGSYGFGRTVKGTWQWLKEAPPDLLKGMNLTSEQVPLMLEGAGAVFTVDYTGTGFLVDRRGLVLTNRHIAEPWWKNDAAERLIKDGYDARFIHLRAWFPGRKGPVTFDRARTTIADDADLAALAFAPDGDLPPPFELAGPERIVAGRRVLLLGYPSGLDALLARTEEDLAARDAEPGQILAALAARDLVRPLPTHGYIGDVLGDRVVFDAATAVGGSGGPLMDMDGRVVAINFGILKAFRGANFGVPAPAAARLLAKAR
jgi:S1-C subfamily serine protease